MVVLTIGIDGSFEGENGDFRAFSPDGIALPGNQAALVNAVAQAVRTKHRTVICCLPLKPDVIRSGCTSRAAQAPRPARRTQLVFTLPCSAVFCVVLQAAAPVVVLVSGSSVDLAPIKVRKCRLISDFFLAIPGN